MFLLIVKVHAKRFSGIYRELFYKGRGTYHSGKLRVIYRFCQSCRMKLPPTFAKSVQQSLFYQGKSFSLVEKSFDDFRSGGQA